MHAPLFARLSLGLVSMVALGACASNSITVDGPNPDTGKRERIQYTRVWWGAVHDAQDDLGLQLFVYTDRKVVPVLYQLQTALGMLGPGDLSSEAELALVALNMGKNSVDLGLIRAQHYYWVNGVRQRGDVVHFSPGALKVMDSMDLHGRVAEAARVELGPESLIVFPLGRSTVGTYGTEFEMEVVVRKGGGPEQIHDVRVLRKTPADLAAEERQRTPEETRAYFQAGGVFR